MLTESDEEQLKLLSVFHYVLAGMTAFLALIPLIYVAIGSFIMATAHTWENRETGPGVSAGAFLVAFGLVLALAIFTVAFIKFLVGRFLARRHNYNFCLVYSIVELVMAPLGTILGIFTLFVLSRPNVKASFADKSILP